MFYLRQQRWENMLTLADLRPFKVWCHWLCRSRWKLTTVNSQMFFFPLHSYYYWLINSLVTGEFTCTHIVVKQAQFLKHLHCVCDVSWLTSTLTSGLLSGVYAFGFLSMAPQLFLNYKVGTASPVNISDSVNRMNERLTPLCAPPPCLDQLKSVSHLPRAVLVYRVSVNTFLHVVLKKAELGLLQIFVFASVSFSSCSSPLLQLPTRGQTRWSQMCAPAPPFSPLPFPSPRLITSPASETSSSSSCTSTSDGGTPHTHSWPQTRSLTHKLSHPRVLLLHLLTRCYSPKNRRRESGSQGKKVKTHWIEEKKWNLWTTNTQKLSWKHSVLQSRCEGKDRALQTVCPSWSVRLVRSDKTSSALFPLHHRLFNKTVKSSIFLFLCMMWSCWLCSCTNPPPSG